MLPCPKKWIHAFAALLAMIVLSASAYAAKRAEVPTWPNDLSPAGARAALSQNPNDAALQSVMPEGVIEVARNYVAETRALGLTGRSGILPIINSPTNVNANSNHVGDAIGETQSEVAVACFGDTVVVAWNDSRGFVAGNTISSYGYSTNGGASFTDGGNVPKALGTDQAFGDTGLDTDEKGNWYLNQIYTRTGQQDIGVHHGRFNGSGVLVWDIPVMASIGTAGTGNLDKCLLACDRTSGNVYVSYTRFTATPQIEIVRSITLGATWGAPIVLDAGTTPTSSKQAARPFCGPGGEVYVVWEKGANYIFCADGSGNIVNGQAQIAFTRSLNFGASYDPFTVIGNPYHSWMWSGPGDNRERANEFPDIAVDRSGLSKSGRIYVTWHEAANWTANISAGVPRAEAADAANNNPGGAELFSVGDDVTGSISAAADFDYWTFSATQGQNLIFVLDPSGFVCGVSPALAAMRIQIFAVQSPYPNPTGFPDSVLAASGQGGFEDRIVWTAPKTGSYVLRLRTAGGTTPYPYTMRVRNLTFLPSPARDARDVVAVYSSNQGTTFTSPQRVNDDPAGLENIRPFVSVDGLGHAHIFWHDHRDPGLGSNACLTSIYGTTSRDGGATWNPNYSITDQLSFFSLNTLAVPNLGDYNQAASSGPITHPAWSDQRQTGVNADVRTPGTNVYTAGRGPEAYTTGIYYSFMISCPPDSTIAPKDGAIRYYTITNTGNLPDQYSYNVTDDNGWIGGPINGSTGTVQPSGTAYVAVTAVSPPACNPPTDHIVFSVTPVGDQDGTKSCTTTLSIAQTASQVVLSQDLDKTYCGEKFTLTAIVNPKNATGTVDFGDQGDPPIYFEGFETGIGGDPGWDHAGDPAGTATRVPSGTNGVTSRTGGFHAEAGQYDLDNQGGSAYTRWGGYSAVFPPAGYTTTIDVYLDCALAGTLGDKRIDWISAINNSGGTHRRDFVFNMGTEAGGFVISGGNNAGRGGANPADPGHDPIHITQTGWYTLKHRFYNDGGVLACALSILDASGNLIHTWIRKDPSDLIGGIGGNRYGWFAAQELPFLAFDNSARIQNSLGVAPVIGGVATLSVATLPVGIHSLIATYSGNNCYYPSSSDKLAHESNPTPSNTALTVSPPKTNCGEKVVLKATVTPAGATGTVEFFDGATSLGAPVPLDATGNAELSIATLAVGVHQLIAKYSGDACYLPSQSDPVAHEVNPAPTTTTLDQDSPKTNFGEKVIFTAKVAPVGATGTVQFFDGPDPLGAPVPVDASGSASISVSTLAPGNHSITARYSGDACYAASTSNKIEHEVNRAPISVVLSQDSPKTNCGEKVTFTATVTPAGATGTVQFFDGLNPLGGPVPVDASGVAQLSISTLGTGIHSITAQYSGDANYAPSTSNKIDHEVNSVPTTTQLTQDSPKTNCGEKVTFTATVGPLGATGTVQFFDGSNPIDGPVPVDAFGQATISVTTLGPGIHSITARYSGDPCHTPSESNKIDHEVNPVPTTIQVTQDIEKTNCGEKVVFTATVNPPGATGTVQFYDGGNPLGPPVPVDALGQASISVSTLDVGIHSITASYSGDACHAPSPPSTSPKIFHEVNPIGTTTQLASNPNPSDFGEKVILTATVNPPGATGTVNFFDGTTPLGQQPLLGGVATLSVTNFTVGTHSLTAVYKGDHCYAPSTSNKVEQIVVPPVSTVMALFKSGTTDDGAVELRWQYGDPDQVVSTTVERAVSASGPWAGVEVERRDDGGIAVAIDRSTASNTTYYYRLAATLRDGQTQRFGPIEATSGDLITEFALARVLPNPTDGPAVMEYTVAKAAKVSLRIVDLQGRAVAKVVDMVQPAGRYQATWNGQSETGGRLSPGVYFVHFKAAGFSSVKRIVVMQ